jgi:serine/threonine protein kinase
MVLHVIIDEPSSIDKARNTKEEAVTTEKVETTTATNKAALQKTGPPRHDDDSESPAEYTKRALALFNQDSKLNRSEVPTVSIHDLLEVGPQLGEGGFSIVSAVKIEDDNNNKGDEESDGSSSWAMKSLRPEVIQGPMGTFKIAAADLWKEAEFLSALHHPGIVALRAKHFSLDSLDENFIILERIQVTLDDQMQVWHEADQKARHTPEVRMQLLKQRLTVCLELCEALQYLHSQNVIYRDLKSSNIGFDKKGKIKLFGKFNVCIIELQIFLESCSSRFVFTTD